MDPSLNRPVGMGVVGCGYWGPNFVRNFHSLSGVSMRMACDTNTERLRHLRSLYPELGTTTHYRELLKDPDVHAVTIATGSREHFSIARECLLSGRHVLVEKPMAHSSEECAELDRIARSEGLVLMVGHTFLYSPAVLKMKELVNRGDIGEIRYISARRLNLGLFRRDANAAWDLAPHDISIILYLFGDYPTAVNCAGNAHITPGIEDVTSMRLQFAGERSALIHSSWLDPRKLREMTVVGSRRMIVYDDLAPQEKLRIFDARIDSPPHYDTFAEFQYAYHHGDVLSPFLKQEEPLKAECAHFIECIQEGKRPLTCAQQGEAVVRVLEASSASLALNGASVSVAPMHTVAAPTPEVFRRTVAA